MNELTKTVPATDFQILQFSFGLSVVQPYQVLARNHFTRETNNAFIHRSIQLSKSLQPHHVGGFDPWSQDLEQSGQVHGSLSF